MVFETRSSETHTQKSGMKYNKNNKNTVMKSAAKLDCFYWKIGKKTVFTDQMCRNQRKTAKIAHINLSRWRLAVNQCIC